MSVVVPDLLTADQVAERLGVSSRQVLRLARQGKLPRVKLGHRTVRFRPDDVRSYVFGHHEQASARRGQGELFDAETPMPSRF